jgi:multiple sugar transport system permease protein
MRRRGEDTLLGIIKYILLVVFLVLTVFPFYWLFVTSVKSDGELLTNDNNVKFIPEEPTITHYVNAFIKTNFGRYIINSLKVTLLASVIVLTAAVLGGYALSRYKFRGKKAVMIFFLASQMVPLITAIVPMFVIFSYFKLINTHGSLVLSYTAANIPFCLVTMASFFRRIPPSLEESAMIDGCGRIQAVIRIVLPVMTPGIMAVFVFTFTGCWNELFYAIMMINSDGLRTIPAGLMNFVQKYNIDWGQMSAAAVITLLPVIIMFTGVQKYIVAGLTQGSVKE